MGLFRRKDQVAALESERRAERSFRQEEKEHENDRCRGAARSGHCFARAGAENSVTARRTVRAKCRRHLPRLSDEGMAAAGQLVKAGLPDPPRSWTGKRLGERPTPRRSDVERGLLAKIVMGAFFYSSSSLLYSVEPGR